MSGLRSDPKDPLWRSPADRGPRALRRRAGQALVQCGCSHGPHEAGTVRVSVSVRMRDRGGRTWVTTPDGRGIVDGPKIDRTLVKALRSAHSRSATTAAPVERRRRQFAPTTARYAPWRFSPQTSNERSWMGANPRTSTCRSCSRLTCRSAGQRNAWFSASKLNPPLRPTARFPVNFPVSRETSLHPDARRRAAENDRKWRRTGMKIEAVGRIDRQ
jgi:hypothetical protein